MPTRGLSERAGHEDQGAQGKLRCLVRVPGTGAACPIHATGGRSRPAVLCDADGGLYEGSLAGRIAVFDAAYEVRCLWPYQGKESALLSMTFLGVGSAFAKRNLHSNVLIEAWSSRQAMGEKGAVPEDTLLIDLGGTGPLGLHQLKDRPGFAYLDHHGEINYPAIKRVFITHQHADHIGGLEEMALMNMFRFGDHHEGRAFKPQIISAINVLVHLWDTSLKGGLNTIPGRYALLQDYFFIHSLIPGEKDRDYFTMGKRYRFYIFATDHIHIQQKYDWPSYGLLMRDTVSGASAFFSGDTRFDYPAYARMMEDARLCFHDVQLFDQPEPVHALLGELQTLPPEIKKKTWLYHYGDTWDSGPFDHVCEEFAGFAKPQQRIVLFE